MKIQFRKGVRELTPEQTYVVLTGELACLQLGLHLWSDYRRQQQTKQLLARPIHLEITLSEIQSEAPQVVANVKR